jgi:hypothetical protein
METLESMNQHRPIDLIENVLTNLNHIVRPNANHVTVERCMMQFT